MQGQRELKRLKTLLNSFWQCFASCWQHHHAEQHQQYSSVAVVNTQSKHEKSPPVWYVGEPSDGARWTHRHGRVLRLARWVSRQCEVYDFGADSVLEVKCEIMPRAGEPRATSDTSERANGPTRRCRVCHHIVNNTGTYVEQSVLFAVQRSTRR